MEVIVLAGGLGTRVASLTKGKLPKPMLLVNNKPFLEYLLDWLESQKVKKVILAIGFQGKVIKNYFGNNYGSLTIVYSDEKDEQLGTGGAIKKAMSLCDKQSVFVVNGDTFFPIGLNTMEMVHNTNNAQITIALKKVENTARYGEVLINKNRRVVNFLEKNKTQNTGLINGGVYLIEKNILEREQKKKFSFEKDILEKLEIKVFGVEFENNFTDIGIPQDYCDFCKRY
jgi:D-glycero-alpha-D-manno-heptose 1-phosphate guanylyltransferase